jgi:ATP-binding cassette subfamily B protein
MSSASVIDTEIRIPDKAWPFLGYAFGILPSRQRAGIIWMCLITGLTVMLDIYMMYGFKLLVDGLQTASHTDPWSTLKWPFLLLTMCCVFHNIGYRIRNVIDAYVMPAMQNTLRETLLGYMLGHSHEYFHNRFAGELATKIGNVNRAWANIIWERLQFGIIPAVFSVIAAAILLWRVDHGIVWILFGVVAALVVTALACGRIMGTAAARVADREGDIMGQMVDTVSNVASVKNFDRVPTEFSLLRRFQDAYGRDYRRQNWTQVWFWAAFDVTISGLVLGFVWRLIDNWSSGHMTLGDTAMCVTVAWDLWWRLGGLSWNLLEMSGDKGRLQEALNEIVRPYDITDAPGAPALKVAGGAIVFEDLVFLHRSGHKVFEHFNLSIRPAEKVGLVGLSGAGKTTLCQLLLRNYDVAGGRILIDGQDIAKVTQSSLRQSVAVIPQDPSLFHRTLKDNILYGRPAANEAEVIAASRAAQADPFIGTLKEGYDTMVGERGVKLSGGQRQRISIARAIIKDAPILILDEATSALDSQTERQIQAALAKAMEGRTTLVIAHRLSTLAHLDRLIVLKGGKVEEEGTLSELLAANGHFAELWRCQADGFLPDKL